MISFFFGFSISQGQGGKGLGVKPVPHFHEAMAANFAPFASLFGALVICDPLVANGLGDLGYKTKEQLADWLQKNTTVTVKDVKTMLFSGLPRGPQAANLTDDDGNSEVAEDRRVQLHRLRRPNQSVPPGREYELPAERLDR